MRSKNFPYLSRLDQLRAFAALLVIFYHFKGIIADVPSSLNNVFFKNVSDIIRMILINGSSGVSLFLVLSAFLFTLITQGGGE